MVPTLRVCKLRFLGALGRGARCSGVGLLLRSGARPKSSWLASAAAPGAPLQHYLHALRCPASPGQQRSAYHPVATVQPARVWLFWAGYCRCASLLQRTEENPLALQNMSARPLARTTPPRRGAAVRRPGSRAHSSGSRPAQPKKIAQDNMKGASTRERRPRISFAAERALGCESAGRGRVQQRPSSSLQSGTRAARLPARSRLGAPGPVSGSARVVDAKGSAFGSRLTGKAWAPALASAWRPSPWPASRPRRPRRAPWARSPSRTSRPSRPARATSSCRPRC